MTAIQVTHEANSCYRVAVGHHVLTVDQPEDAGGDDLGPTADFGPFPIGIRTLALADPSRNAVGGTGPRPVTTEVSPAR